MPFRRCSSPQIPEPEHVEDLWADLTTALDATPDLVTPPNADSRSQP